MQIKWDRYHFIIIGILLKSKLTFMTWALFIPELTNNPSDEGKILEARVSLVIY